MRQQFIDKLKSTGRQGIDNVIEYLDRVGFFSAPASVNRHLSQDGGLLEHSFNVLKMAEMLRLQVITVRPDYEDRLPEDSITIAALLHDVCKSNIYHRIKKWRKDENDRWEQYDSYDSDYSRFPIGHGEKSVIMLLKLGLELSNDEIIAIRWHMGAWNLPMHSFEDKSNISAAFDNCPLAVIIHTADYMATHIIENEY